METALDIIRIVMQILIAGAIGLFVIKRLKAKQKRETFVKKETEGVQTLLNSLIPFGMIFGCVTGLLFGIIFLLSLPTAIALGASLGLLTG